MMLLLEPPASLSRRRRCRGRHFDNTARVSRPVSGGMASTSASVGGTSGCRQRRRHGGRCGGGRRRGGVGPLLVAGKLWSCINRNVKVLRFRCE